MARKSKPSRENEGHVVESIVQFSKDLQSQYSRRDGNEESIQDLNNELENQINNLKLSTHSIKASQHHRQLDTAGLDLWNWGIRQKRNEEDQPPPENERFFVLVRVLSFFMLACAQRNHDNSREILFRLANLAIRTGRSCIDKLEYDFALLALQKAAECNSALQALKDTLSEDDLQTCRQLEIQYSSLRIVLAWKQDRMDVAEHVYCNLLEKIEQPLNISSVENVSDAFFEIGKDLKDKNNPILGVKWLERAIEVIDSQDIDLLSRETVEMRTAISQALIRGYLETNTPDALDKAKNHVAFMESELGGKLIVLLLRIDILLHGPDEELDYNAYANILRRMIKVIDLSDSSFKLVIHHVRKLAERNHEAALAVLNEFLAICVLRTQREEWIDQTVILCVHLAIQHDRPDAIEVLSEIFDQTRANSEKSLPTIAAVGVQTLLSKKADNHFSQEQFDVAGRWYRLALHPALEQSGPSNIAKLSRKSLLCAIQGNDLNDASAVLHSMSEATRTEPMTSFLAFRLALRNQDSNEASKYLAQISSNSTSDPKYLYACCLAAQEAQDKFCTVEALRYLVAKHDLQSSESVHLPALLRLLIRLETESLKEKGEGDKRFLEDDICNLVEKAVVAMKQDRGGSSTEKLFTVSELDWFCKNAYNLGLSNCTTWEARNVVRIMEACLSITLIYPSDIPPDTALDVSLRGMFCGFTAATVLLALARSEDNLELQLQHYTNMRSHISHFSSSLDTLSEKFDDSSRQELNSKLSALSVFEFEGAVCLKAWDDLKSIILKAKVGQNPSVFGAMADCTLRCQFMPAKVTYQTMREIINQTWILESFDVEKLAKYMKCLLKVTLPMEHRISLSLIGEICSIVKELASKRRQFPSLELEWIIASAFNQGLDLFSAKEDDLSRSWIDHAMTLAQYLGDGGAMTRQLQDASLKLRAADIEDNVL